MNTARDRGFFYNLADNFIGYDDGVTTPGERAGAGLNALARMIWEDPTGTVSNALTAFKGDLDNLMFEGGAMERPEAVMGYAAAPMAPAAMGGRVVNVLSSGGAKPRTVYRGTTGGTERITGGISDGDLFVTPFEDVARLYGDKIDKFDLSPDAKVLVEGTPEFAKLTGRRKGPLLRTMRQGENLRDAANDAAAKARAAGYDAIEFNSMKDLGIAVFNQSILKSGD